MQPIIFKIGINHSAYDSFDEKKNLSNLLIKFVKTEYIKAAISSSFPLFLRNTNKYIIERRKQKDDSPQFCTH